MTINKLRAIRADYVRETPLLRSGSGFGAYEPHPDRRRMDITDYADWLTDAFSAGITGVWPPGESPAGVEIRDRRGAYLLQRGDTYALLEIIEGYLAALHNLHGSLGTWGAVAHAISPGDPIPERTLLHWAQGERRPGRMARQAILAAARQPLGFTATADTPSAG